MMQELMRRPVKRRRCRRVVIRQVLLVLGTAAFVAGCSQGKMRIREVHYLAVPSTATGPAEGSTNYFRVRVEADSKLGVADYRSGWFPARAVDNLFGEVSTEGGVEALRTRQALETRYNEAILSAQDQYLDAVQDPTTDLEEIANLNLMRQRVRAFPTQLDSLPEGDVVEIEYNPELGLVLNHANEKLVFFFGSNPDDVIGAIANFAESDETSLAVLRLGEVIAGQAAAEVAETEARNAAAAQIDRLIKAQIDAANEEVNGALGIELSAGASNTDIQRKAEAQQRVAERIAALMELLRTLN